MPRLGARLVALPLVHGLRTVAISLEETDGSALPTIPLYSVTRLAKVTIAKIKASGPSSAMARASVSQNPRTIWLRTESRVSLACWICVTAKSHFLNTFEPIFKQLIHKKFKTVQGIRLKGCHNCSIVFKYPNLLREGGISYGI